MSIWSNKEITVDAGTENFSAKEKALWDELFICMEEINAVLHKTPIMVKGGSWSLLVAPQIAAYFLYLASTYNDPFSITFEELLRIGADEDMLSAARELGIDVAWEELRNLVTVHEPHVFRLTALLNTSSSEISTPYSIQALAEGILDVGQDDVFADLCCGNGLVASNFKRFYPDIEVYGYDISKSAIAVARIQNIIREGNIHYYVKDIFDLEDDNTHPDFTKIFTNYPFGLRIREQFDKTGYFSILAKRIPSISRATSSDWVFNSLISDLLPEKGKAVCVSTNGSLWNTLDTPVRKYFIENGLIECVIALPARIFESSNVATSLLVLSHGNKGVQLVDATETYQEGRRTNDLSDDDIEKILAACKNDSEISMFISLEELRQNDYVLNSGRYIHISKPVKNGVPFGSIIKRITRGAPMTAKELDNLSSTKPTNMQYITISNIHDGIIDRELPYLTKIDKKNERYCLSNRCLVMSKNGSPYKVAVAETKEENRILANGNLYLIEIDEMKADPYYIAAYFESEQGVSALKSITVGVTIPNIGVDQLKKLIIPLPDINRQTEIAKEYIATKDEIVLLQIKLERARARMSRLIGEEG